MATKLVVTQAFGNLAKGTMIGDPADAERFAASHPKHVVRISVPDEPKPVQVAPPPPPASPSPPAAAAAV